MSWFAVFIKIVQCILKQTALSNASGIVGIETGREKYSCAAENIEISGLCYINIRAIDNFKINPFYICQNPPINILTLKNFKMSSQLAPSRLRFRRSSVVLMELKPPFVVTANLNLLFFNIGIDLSESQSGFFPLG